MSILLFTAVACIHLRHAGPAWDPLVLLTLLYLLGFGVMVSLLACYHGQLVGANLTTNEHQNFYRYEYFRVGWCGVGLGCFWMADYSAEGLLYRECLGLAGLGSEGATWRSFGWRRLGADG